MVYKSYQEEHQKDDEGNSIHEGNVRKTPSTLWKKEKPYRKVLTIVNRLVPLDVDRTEFEPGVVPGVSKFTHFISADVAVIRIRKSLEETPPRGARQRRGPKTVREEY